MKIKFAKALATSAVLMLSMGAAQAGDAAAGKALFTAKGCVGCHGANAEGMGNFPKLAGQMAADIEAKLKAYRAGETRGAMTPVMAPNAKPLSDADIANVAAYVSGLK